MRPGRYGAIDIGTVTCRLLIADVDADGLHEVKRGYGITNLGEGVDATGMLKVSAMQRVVAQVSEFLTCVESYRDEEHPAIELVVMATSAARDAKNSSEFLMLLDKLGVQLTIIPGEKEAALSFDGVAYDFPDENLLVIDIGGGSTECSAGRSGGTSCKSVQHASEQKPGFSLKSAPLFSHSFDVGCRRVTERFFRSDPPTDEELGLARSWIYKTMQAFFDHLETSAFLVERMVAVAGTATSIVSIHEHMEVYESSKVHRKVVTREILGQVYESLRNMSLEKRKEVVGLDPGRASVIVAGLIILDVALELGGQDFFTVSESDILQGIILDTATK